MIDDVIDGDAWSPRFAKFLIKSTPSAEAGTEQQQGQPQQHQQQQPRVPVPAPSYSPIAVARSGLNFSLIFLV